MVEDARSIVRAVVERLGPGGPGLVRTDSRKITKGDVFLAYRGVHSDGHAHVKMAAERGAALVIVEDSAAASGLACPSLKVESGRAAWTWLAAAAAGDPQDHLTLLGVTGTNGKTSTVWMTGQLLRAAGVPCLTIGTLGAYFGSEHQPTGHTTPDPDVLYPLLQEAVRRGIKVVAMEVSSHAICQEKLLPLRFKGCAFTSFSRDHLDFHGTMAEYFDAKVRLFSELARDDATFAYCDELPEEPPYEGLAYGFSPDANLRIVQGATGFSGTELELVTKNGRRAGKVPYFAKHALENFAAATVMAAAALGKSPDPATWAQLQPVPGRLEQVFGPKGSPGVVVDYAHTPDALEKTLGVLKLFCKGLLTCVFGCGGDRDRGKRPEMGEVAERLADRVVVTSDNPRTEDPLAIIKDITNGMQGAATVEADREAAIAAALAGAGPDDMVLIAGKGHETYQIVGARTLPFDDRDVARRILERR